MKIAQKIADQFKQMYRSEPIIVRSPGRVNIIGEHTDYNLGPVLPAAINKYIYLAIGTRSDTEISIYANDYSDQYSASIAKLEKAWKLWPNYLLGVVNEMQKDGKHLTGINIVFGGDIPLAAGLSSSAAITCATAFAINQLFDFGYSKIELAKIAQRAEHNYVGVHCGLMDQFASIFGKEGHLIKLNCTTEEHVYIPFTATNIKVVLFDTGVKHHLVTSAYNERREQCQSGIDLVKKFHPEVNGLPDITEQMLLEHVKPVSEVVFKRCLYVIQEIDRLEKACKDLEVEDFKALGQRMFATHYGLKDMYEVSCDECDFLVDTTKNIPGVLGSRMMGAGFGGCTINLIYSTEVDAIVETVKDEYRNKFRRELKVYLTSIGNGTEELKNLLEPA
ncbi:MAG: galactokinase [Pyrinomonadaceae bacterium]|nr:galactokinase [Sphingobacteriaceae bacterium]